MNNQGDILIKSLTDGGAELGISFTDLQLQQFKQYYLDLINTNQHINLTSITDPHEVAVKHFLDSLICLQAADFQEKQKIIDVGSGAGFPGMVLKIFCRYLEVDLLDSLQKRIDFLNNVIANLKLTDIRAIHGRAEELGQNKLYREKYDIVVSRAVANLTVLAEYCLPLAKIGGSFIALKGPNAHLEIKEAERAVAVLGGELAAVNKLELPILKDQRTIIVFKKVFAAPDKYPRRSGMPAKKPLK